MTILKQIAEEIEERRQEFEERKRGIEEVTSPGYDNYDFQERRREIEANNLLISMSMTNGIKL